MLNTFAGLLGLLVQLVLLAGVYLLAAPRRSRSAALLYGLLAAVEGYALVLLGAMVVGIPWQTTNMLLALGVGGALLIPSVRARLMRAPSALRVLLGSHWLAIALVGAAVAIQMVAVVVMPEVSIDGQLYHGPVLAQLLQHGTVWGWQAPNQYLFYTDLTMVGGVNLAAFTGGAVFDNGVQIPHLILLAAGIVMALRARFRASWHRVTFALLLVTAPVVWLQPRILYVDLAYGAAVASLIFLIVFIRRPRALDLAMAGIAGGAIIATKPAGALTGILLLGVYLVVTLVRLVRERSFGGFKAVPLGLAFLAPIVLASGFYVRNAISFSNPIYPVVADFGPLHLPGIVDFSVFASGARGAGLLDPLRLQTYAESIVSGALSGVLKPDYDPRAGGFGHLPLIVLAIVILVLVGQAIWILSARRTRLWTRRATWLRQGALVLLGAAVLLVQPATFDARYVIGPTVAIGVAVLTIALVRNGPALVDLLAALIALAAVVGQVTWTELETYPGARAIAQMRSDSSVWQAPTPGNPWGRSTNVSWLPRDASRCETIALQTEGGLTPRGMDEQSLFGTLAYALYGEALCNTVIPVQLAAYQGSHPLSEDALAAADYLLLYPSDVEAWRELIPEAGACWVEVGAVSANEAYPQAHAVFRNVCR